MNHLQQLKCLKRLENATHQVSGGRAVYFLVASEAGSAVGWTSHQELCLPALAGSFGMRLVGSCGYVQVFSLKFDLVN